MKWLSFAYYLIYHGGVPLLCFEDGRKVYGITREAKDTMS